MQIVATRGLDMSKIKVEHIPNVQKLEFKKLDNGSILSYGRSLPF